MSVEALPTKVTPFVLRAAETMCPRRLGSELQSEPGTADPVNRARVRNALLDALRLTTTRCQLPVRPVRQTGVLP